MAPNPAQRARARRRLQPQSENGLATPNAEVAISNDTEGRCEFCNAVWYEKGLGECGHVHCKACPTEKEPWKEREAVKGQVWEVYCKKLQAENVVVKAVDMAICPSYDPPENIFVTPCRMLHIVVGKGDTTETFTVHSPLFTTVSSYFTNALKTNNYAEGQSNRFELTDEDPRIFGLLSRYLYLGYVQDLDFELGYLDSSNAAMADYCRVWLLAHYFQIAVLQKHCIWCLVKLVNQKPTRTFDEIEDLYERAPLESVLRRLVVDICVWGDQVDFGELSDDVPTMLSRELVRGFKRRCGGKGSNPLEDVRIYYEKAEKEKVVVEAKEEVKGEMVGDIESDY